MIYKKINLFLYSVLLIVAFLTVPVYNHWLFTKILSDSWPMELKHMSLADRNMRRFGGTYIVYQDIAKRFGNRKDITVLLPPTAYIRALGIKSFVTSEPAVFYYFTGLKAVSPDSPAPAQANWILLVKGENDADLRKMSDIDNPDSLINLYKQFTR